MELNSYQLKIIDRWLSAVETGKPNGDYTNVTVFADGPGGKKQITYGKHQTTESGRNVQKMVKMYVDAKGGDVPSILKKFAKAKSYSMVSSQSLRKALREAGKDPIMERVQDEFFFTKYMSRANKWAKDNGFTTALAMLVIYDSFVHSGSVRMDIRRRFREKPPAQGGNEKKWITSYIEARHQWLKTRRNPIVRKTIYRTRGLADLAEKQDWDLYSKPIKVNGITVTTSAKPPTTYEGLIPCPTCGGTGTIQHHS